jgi:hypothetical protein
VQTALEQRAAVRTVKGKTTVAVPA